MSELREVISTRSIGGVCVRENLGMACVADTSYDCSCKDVVSGGADVVPSDNGPVYVISLELELGADTKPLIKAVGMTPYRADWYVKNRTLDHGPRVEISYSLDRPENRDLKAYVEQSV